LTCDCASISRRRIGGNAQIKAMRQWPVCVVYAQFRELTALAQLVPALDRPRSSARRGEGWWP
jgi:F0F1-type ATP synthase alpha subunit